MHVLQQIAIKADSAEEAFNNVKHKFDEMYSESEGLGGWSDWYVVGGGRWNSNPNNQYQDNYNDVVSHNDTPDKFMEVLEGSLTARKEEMGRIKERLDLDKFMELVNNFIDSNGNPSDDDRFDMTSYYVRSAASMINGYWNQDSYFYDLENYSATPKYMLEEIDKGSKKWYLVPVDFHF
jgi:hypothetical protein